jgi:uncharacterized DUF497 family protein
MHDHQWRVRDIPFACDRQKRKSNLKKHAIDLIKASHAFLDPFAVHGYDAEHSINEERYQVIGKMDNEILVFAAYTLRDGTVRLISARRAAMREKMLYERR